MIIEAMIIEPVNMAGHFFPIIGKFFGHRLCIQGYYFGRRGGVRQGPLFLEGVSYRSGVPEEGPSPPPLVYFRLYRGVQKKHSFLWPVDFVCTTQKNRF